MSRHFDLAVKRARAEFGGQRAFDQLGLTLRRGLIAREVVALLDAQDDAIDPRNVRMLLTELADELSAYT